MKPSDFKEVKSINYRVSVVETDTRMTKKRMRTIFVLSSMHASSTRFVPSMWMEKKNDMIFTSVSEQLMNIPQSFKGRLNSYSSFLYAAFSSNICKAGFFRISVVYAEDND